MEIRPDSELSACFDEYVGSLAEPALAPKVGGGGWVFFYLFELRFGLSCLS